MKKTIHENTDGTFTAVAGVRCKRVATREEAQRFLDGFSGRCHAHPVDNSYERTKTGVPRKGWY